MVSILRRPGQRLAGVFGRPSTTSEPSYEEESEALFTQMGVDGTEPDDTRKGHINTLIAALKTAGVWDKCDRIYMLAAHEEAAAKIDWKNPGTDSLTPRNAPTFTADTGYTTTGTGSKDVVGATNFDAFTQYTQNSAHVSLWVLTYGSTTDNGAVGMPGAATMLICPRNGSDLVRWRCNAASTSTAANADGTGFFITNRAAAATHTAWRNGAQIGTAAVASGAVSASPLVIGQAAGSFSGQNVNAFVSIGADISAEAEDFYDALLAYMQAVGAV